MTCPKRFKMKLGRSENSLRGKSVTVRTSRFSRPRQSSFPPAVRRNSTPIFCGRSGRERKSRSACNGRARRYWPAGDTLCSAVVRVPESPLGKWSFTWKRSSDFVGLLRFSSMSRRSPGNRLKAPSAERNLPRISGFEPVSLLHKVAGRVPTAYAAIPSSAGSCSWLPKRSILENFPSPAIARRVSPDSSLQAGSR